MRPDFVMRKRALSRRPDHLRGRMRKPSPVIPVPVDILTKAPATVVMTAGRAIRTP